MITSDWQTASYSGKQGNCVQARWQQSTRCSDGGCVEINHALGEGIHVRDSKLGDDSPILTFTYAEWDAFIKGVKDGEFDLPETVTV